MNPYLLNIPGYKEAIENLPIEEVTIDDNFLETHKEAIDSLKEIFSGRGGIHVISKEDSERNYPIIVRVPSKANQEKLMKELSAKKKTPLEVQTSLIFENLLYPSPEIVQRWLEEAPGLPIAYGNELTDLAGTTATAIRKKL